LRPWWGTENAPIRFTAVAKGALGVGPALDIIRGRRPRRARDDGDSTYVSHNINGAELVVDCGLTIDGEMYAPSARTVQLSACDRIRFVRTD
jgi:hypothetical protein